MTDPTGTDPTGTDPTGTDPTGTGPRGQDTGEHQRQDDQRQDDQPPPSGLRNPAAAMRGAGAVALVMEAIVLLLALAPLRMLGGRYAGAGMLASLVLAVLCCVLAGLLRHRWAWYAGIGIQVLVVATGVAQWAIAVIGVIFAAIWLYLLHLRRTILGRT